MDLVWDDSTKKLFETGLDRAALFVQDSNGLYPLGVAWNGVTSVSEKPDGAEPTRLYANNTVYATLLSVEKFSGVIKAYTFPDEFLRCDGSVETDGVTIFQQTRVPFGLVYRTKVGSAAVGMDAGYKYHVLYGCLASPSEQEFQTINESPSAITFSWDFSCTPVGTGDDAQAPTARLVIDSLKVTPTFLTWFENQVFGNSPTNVSHLPLPEEILTQAAL